LGKVDTGSKKIIHLYNQAWLEWILQQSIEIETELSGEFQFIARASDIKIFK
jgi:hypothetical protein